MMSLASWKARLLKRAFKHVKSQGAERSDTGPETLSTTALSTSDPLTVREVDDGEAWAGELFRRKFGDAAPNFPRHFVSLYRDADREYTAGYVHYTAFEDGYLCGGLVIDDRLYRRMPPTVRATIRGFGGIAEHLLRTSFAQLREPVAIWGYVGDLRAERVDLRVGFRKTIHPHIMVCWMQEVSDEEMRARFDRVVQLGPF